MSLNKLRRGNTHVTAVSVKSGKTYPILASSVIAWAYEEGDGQSGVTCTEGDEEDFDFGEEESSFLSLHCTLSAELIKELRLADDEGELILETHWLDASGLTVLTNSFTCAEITIDPNVEGAVGQDPEDDEVATVDLTLLVTNADLMRPV